MKAGFPVRWRLTLWYAGSLTAAMLLLGGALYLGLRDRLYDALDEQVMAQLSVAQADVQVDSGELSLAGDLALFDDDAFIRLMNLDGETVARLGEEFDDVPVPTDPVAAALQGHTSISTAEANDETLSMRTAPVHREGAIIGVLQAGLPSEDVVETLNVVVGLLVIGVPIALVLAVGGGYVLAGRALAPVATIADLAARIDESDLHARLGLDLPDDELGRLASTFDDMLARIEKAFERQRRFTGDAAHELRTPLSLMRSQVDLALARPRSAAVYRDALEGIDIDLERLIRLVAALLTLARADAGQLTLERAPFDLAETIELMLEQYGASADAAAVALVSQASSAVIVADEDLVIQVLVNLLDNALAHTPTGGRIAVGCAREGDQVRLWVADTGPGIAAEHRERIFDRFYRVDTGRTRDVGGTGLGLAITRTIVEMHGGTIFLSDRVGPGTRVEMLLPAGPERRSSP